MNLLALFIVAFAAFSLSRPISMWLAQNTSNFWNVAPIKVAFPAVYGFVFTAMFAVGYALFGMPGYSVLSFIVTWTLIGALEYFFQSYRR
jgi:hypothetical protein